MSGGSYNYLTTAADVYGIGGLLQRQEDLRNMAHRLDGVCPEAAAETRLFVEGGTVEQQAASIFHGIDAHLARLQPLWKAVEWRDSNDWGEDRLLEAIAAYRALGPSPEVYRHGGCFRPQSPQELAYFVKSSHDETHRMMLLDTISVPNLVGALDRVELRYLLVLLEDATERVRDALEWRVRADRAAQDGDPS